METKILEKIGLTEGESRVYLALLKIGKSTIGNIIKESGVSNSKVYNILDRLAKKGLVGSIIENNTRNFEAKSPSRLTEFVEEKERQVREEKQEIQKLIPQLEQIQKNAESPQEAEILQGKNGLITIAELVLKKVKKGDEVLVFGIPKEAMDLMGVYYKGWHERRAKKGIRCRMLYNRTAKELGIIRRKIPLTQTRFLPKEIITPALVFIGENYVSIELFGDNTLAFVIRNKKVADSYRVYFNLLWKISKTR